MWGCFIMTNGRYRLICQKERVKILDQSQGYDTIRYDTRCYFNVRSKADISQLNLPHGTDN